MGLPSRKRDNLDLLIEALEAFNPETFDPDAPENALPPEIEAGMPQITERCWQKIKARLDAEGWPQDPPGGPDPADVPVFARGPGGVQ